MEEMNTRELNQKKNDEVMEDIHDCGQRKKRESTQGLDMPKVTQ